MPTEQAAECLMESYKTEVEYRHRKFMDDAQTRANVSNMAKFLTSDTSKFGVMLCGLCGNGKSTLIYALQSMLNAIWRLGGFGSNDVGLSIISAKEIAKYAKDAKAFASLKQREMLAIDDMGREASEVIDYGNVECPLVDLIEYRYNHQLFTIITTNLKPSEIKSRYDIRIADRFREMLEVIVFENPSYRN